MKLKPIIAAMSAAVALLSGASQAAPSYSVTDLGTLGGIGSGALGINNSGQIVGIAAINDGNFPHAFLYSGGRMTDLGTLGGSNSEAYGINASGEVVGLSYTADNAQRAFLYSGANMTDLNSLIDPRSGWTLSNASGINDSGQIAANGYHPTVGRRALLLSPIAPVPEPETYALMLAGLSLVGFAAQRRERKALLTIN